MRGLLQARGVHVPSNLSMRRDDEQSAHDAASDGAPAVPRLPTVRLPAFSLRDTSPAADAAADPTRLVSLDCIVSAMAPSQLHVLLLIGRDTHSRAYTALLADVCMLMRALGPTPTARAARAATSHLVSGCTVLMAPGATAARAHACTELEGAYTAEGHPLHVLRQTDEAAHETLRRDLEGQLGFEIGAGANAALLSPSGECVWLDYGPAAAANAPPTELAVRVWELLADK
jgi:hypothetical protein